MSTYDTILFDLDLTLFDFASSERLAFSECAIAAGLPDEPHVFERYKVINDALWARVEKGELTPSQVSPRRFEALIGDLDGSLEVDPGQLGKLFQQGLGRHGELYPGTADVLDGLVDQFALALVTNGVTAVQRSKVARLDLDQWFDPIVISDEVGIAKPDPAIFDLVFAELGEERRSSAIMVGDSLTSDIAGAQAAGIATCWYNPTKKPIPNAAALAPVDHVIEQLSDVATVVRT